MLVELIVNKHKRMLGFVLLFFGQSHLEMLIHLSAAPMVPSRCPQYPRMHQKSK